MVREESAKLLYSGSIPLAASTRTFGLRADARGGVALRPATCLNEGRASARTFLRENLRFPLNIPLP